MLAAACYSYVNVYMHIFLYSVHGYTLKFLVCFIFIKKY